MTQCVMMQYLQFCRMHDLPDGLSQLDILQYVLQPTVLTEANSNFYLTSLLLCLPIDFENSLELRQLAADSDFTWFIWTVDRDICNALV